MVTTYLNQGGVLITGAKISVHGTNYPLENITSYKVEKHHKRIPNWKGLIIIACVVISIITIARLWFRFEFLASAIGGIIIAIIFVLWAKEEEPFDKFVFDHYELELTTSSASKHFVYTKSREFIYEVEAALEEAIESRAKTMAPSINPKT